MSQHGMDKLQVLKYQQPYQPEVGRIGSTLGTQEAAEGVSNRTKTDFLPRAQKENIKTTKRINLKVNRKKLQKIYTIKYTSTFLWQRITEKSNCSFSKVCFFSLTILFIIFLSKNQSKIILKSMCSLNFSFWQFRDRIKYFFTRKVVNKKLKV